MNKVILPIDSIGIIASTLCGIHCIATPFLFIAKACTATCCSEAPVWWVMIDYLFLIISFLAIYFIRNTINTKWLKKALWMSWSILLFTIVNHSLNIVVLPNNFIYIPSASIIILHFYNLQFCKCSHEKCY